MKWLSIALAHISETPEDVQDDELIDEEQAQLYAECEVIQQQMAQEGVILRKGIEYCYPKKHG